MDAVFDLLELLSSGQWKWDMRVPANWLGTTKIRNQAPLFPHLQSELGPAGRTTYFERICRTILTPQFTTKQGFSCMPAFNSRVLNSRHWLLNLKRYLEILENPPTLQLKSYSDCVLGEKVSQVGTLSFVKLTLTNSTLSHKRRSNCDSRVGHKWMWEKGGWTLHSIIT